jgi:methyl-accepting chemotaxis protein
MSTNLLTRVNSLSFKTKAILLATLLAVVPVIGTGAFSASVSAKNFREKEIEQQQAFASAFSQNLARFLDFRSGDIQAVSIIDAVNDRLLLAKTPVATIERQLKVFADRFKVYDHIAILDLQGRPIAASTYLNLKSSYGDRDYFQQTLATNQPQISTVEINRSSNRSAFYLTVPTYDKAGKIVAVIQARMPVTAISKVAKTFESDRNKWFVVDTNSQKILLATDDMQSGSNAAELTSYQSLGSNKTMTREDLNQYTKRQQLVSYNRLSSSSGNDLKLVAVSATDLADLIARERQIWIAIGLGTLVAGGLTAGMAFLLSDRITKYIQRTIASITNSANEIVDTVQSQEITVNQQANTAIETTNTINQLESLSTESAAQAASSATGARQALSLSEEGTQAVQQTLRGMSDLRDNVDEIAAQVVNLGEQTGQITNISDLVSDLAKQTNMLALKAAVEAARVGEQGKGFGVVAGEIRKLAEESKKSAEKINNLATDIQVSINRTVMVTDRGTKTVSEGIQLAQNTAQTFMGVTDAVNNVFLNSQQISSAAKQQATAIQQVLGAMTIVSQGSQESAIGMHKMKTSTRELTQIADELQAVVS